MNISLSDILRQIVSRKSKFVLCLFFSICKALFYGWIFAYEVKQILTAIESGDAHQLSVSVAWLIIAVFSVAVINILYTRFKTRIINQLTVEFEDVFIRSYHSYYTSGNDVSEKLTLLQNTLPNLLNQLVEYVFGVVYLISVLIVSILYGILISVTVTLIGIFVSLIMVLFTKKLGKDVRQYAKESEAATNDVYGKLWEYNDNLEILPFLAPDHTYKHLEEAIDRENALKIQVSKLTNLSRILMRFSNVGTVLAGGILGGVLICLQKITSSDLMALIILLPIISDNLFQIPNKINDLNGIKGMCSALAGFIREEDREIQECTASQIGKIEKIEFKDFVLSINEETRVEINSLILESGGVYGIYGPSGIGKTSLFRVLIKICDDISGEILINDSAQLRDISHREWWNRILYLNQEGTIFPGNLIENICMSEEYEKERFEAAVRLAGMEELVSERTDLQDGISVENLSSGERQQLCLARMFYMERDVVLLDEATSALSPKREDEVLKNILNWARQRGCIILMISHSSEIKKFCDKIIEIN
ncbi:MAG: ABC transporter ATP-binding protein/permease [Roseburia sp.]|nr:ABC transporter ATP-binding protein/permease [Roseburia sp.]